MKRRILVVQRNGDEAAETADFFRRLGHRAFCLKTSREAIDLLKDTSFDAVCLDWPAFKDVLVYLRTEPRFESVPVFVLVDAPIKDEDVFDGYHFGGDMVLGKPLEPEAWDFLSKL